LLLRGRQARFEGGYVRVAQVAQECRNLGVLDGDVGGGADGQTTGRVGGVGVDDRCLAKDAAERAAGCGLLFQGGADERTGGIAPSTNAVACRRGYAVARGRRPIFVGPPVSLGPNRTGALQGRRICANSAFHRHRRAGWHPA
jgi:hypothetical protein